MKRKNASPELALHKAVACFLNTAIKPPQWWTTIPAGGGGAARGAKLKAMGYKAGTPDILLIDRGRALWIELKEKGGDWSDSQKVTFPNLTRAGTPVFVCRSVQEVEWWLREIEYPLHATVPPKRVAA